MDIEYENSNIGNRQGIFTKCEFKYNRHYGMICDQARAGMTRDFFIRDIQFNFCDFAGSEFGYSAYPNSRNFTFRNCNFYGNIIHAYMHILNYRVNPFNTNYLNDNTKVYSCVFSEDYEDPNLLPLGVRSFATGWPNEYPPGTPAVPSSADPNYCPILGHEWLVNFTGAAHVRFDNCTLITDFRLKFWKLSFDLPLHLPQDSYNQILNTVQCYNNGLNGCNCLTDLASIRYCDIRGNLYYHMLAGCFNCPVGCPIPNYYCVDFNCNIFPPFNILSSIAGQCVPTSLPTWCPCVNYTDPVVNNAVTDLFTTDPLCPVIVPFGRCVESFRFRADESTITAGLLLYPNPTNNILMISADSTINELRIYDSLGSLISTVYSI
jgi:hypothetical protein